MNGDPLFAGDVVMAFADVLGPRLPKDVSLEDFLAGGFELARRRAALHDREAFPLDAEFAFSLFCRWPFKPPPAPQYVAQVAEIRVTAFSGAAAGRTGDLYELVPDATLLLTHEQLYQRLASGVVEELLQVAWPMRG